MSSHVVLVSCGSKKLDRRSQAQHLYTGVLFRYSLKYAKKLEPSHIYILSARHGLLALEQQINPYDQTLNSMPASKVQNWADQVISQLSQKFSLDETHFVILAGQRYRKYLQPHMQHVDAPLTGLTIGKQIQKLKLLCHE